MQGRGSKGPRDRCQEAGIEMLELICYLSDLEASWKRASRPNSSENLGLL